MTFPPALAHGPITKVADGVHHVRGAFRMGPGITISRTMTILESPDGLVVLNAVRLGDAGMGELDRLGKVRHLVKLSESHGLDEPFYADRYEPEVWAAPGTKHEAGVGGSKELGPASPIAGGVVIEFPGSTGWKERALWVPSGGGTLIACDALQHHVDAEHASAFGRLMMSMMGFKGGLIVAPMWRKYQKLQGAQVAKALAGVSQLGFANVVTGHGPAIVGGADKLAKAAIERAAQA